MAKLAKNWIAVALDGDMGGNKRVMKKFGATGYPTVVFLDPEEKVLGRFVGAVGTASVKGDMEKYFEEYAKEAADVEWASSLDEALAMAAEGDKLVFVFFKNKKKNSKLVERITLENIRVLQAIGTDYVAVKIELDRKAEPATTYKVKSAPTFLILDAEGNLIDKATTAKKPKQAIKFLRNGKKAAERAKAKKGGADY